MFRPLGDASRVLFFKVEEEVIFEKRNAIDNSNGDGQGRKIKDEITKENHYGCRCISETRE